MKNKKVKKILIAGFFLAVFGIALVLFILFRPHRDTQASPVDYTLSATELVLESLGDANATNDKYLAEDGDSKIMAITGMVFSIEIDYDSNQVVLLKNDSDDAGVKCTFMHSTNKNIEKLSVGETVTIKGVFRVAASYDEDFEEYEDVIAEECDILNEK